MVRFDSSRPLIVAFLLMSMTMTMKRIQATADIKCPQVEFFNAKNDVIHTKVDINITFSVRFDNCSSNYILIVKISEQMRERCKIIYNKSSCLVSSQSSSSCSCTPVTGLTTFVTRRNETGNITYTWSWRFPGSEENFRNFTFLFSEYDAYNTTDRSSSGYVFNIIIIIIGSTVGSLTIIIVVSIILIFGRKGVKKTFTLPIPFPEWLDDCGADDEGQKDQQVARRYQDINDALFHQSFEMSLCTNLSPPPEECDPGLKHFTSQGGNDLVRQSSGSLYGQVYDALLVPTAAVGAAS